MKTAFYFLCFLLLFGCTEDEGENMVSVTKPSSGLPVFDAAFFTMPDKPQESVTYFAPDTISVGHRIVYHYNRAGDIAEEVNFFEEDNYYSSMRYWYDGGRLIFQKFKENPWYTQYVYNNQNQRQYRFNIDLRPEVPDTTSVATFHYFNGGNTVVLTDLPELDDTQLPEGSYFYDSLLYQDGRLLEEYRKYTNSVDGVFHLQAKRAYVYGEQDQLIAVRLVDGISNVHEGSTLFDPGVIETYSYDEDNRLKELRTYDAYKGFALSNIQKFIYPE